VFQFQKQSVPQILIWNTITARPCYKKLFFFVSSSNNVSINRNLQVLSNVNACKILLMLLEPLPSFLSFNILNKGHFCHLKKPGSKIRDDFITSFLFWISPRYIFWKFQFILLEIFSPICLGISNLGQKFQAISPLTTILEDSSAGRLLSCGTQAMARNYWESFSAVQGSILRS
jgi:hypothetical protein